MLTAQSTTTAQPEHTLADLNDHDAALLSLYLTDCNLHMHALARASGLGILAIIAFLARADVAPYIAHFHRLRESAQRATALGHLRELVETSKDPTEQRRACQHPPP